MPCSSTELRELPKANVQLQRTLGGLRTGPVLHVLLAEWLVVPTAGPKQVTLSRVPFLVIIQRMRRWNRWRGPLGHGLDPALAQNPFEPVQRSVGVNHVVAIQYDGPRIIRRMK